MTRPIGTATELERRRRRAVDLVDQGESPATVARVLGVHETSVHRWRRLARQPHGLAAKPIPGPTPRLSDYQLHKLESFLRQGAHKHGWPNRLWTADPAGLAAARPYLGDQLRHAGSDRGATGTVLRVAARGLECAG